MGGRQPNRQYSSFGKLWRNRHIYGEFLLRHIDGSDYGKL